MSVKANLTMLWTATVMDRLQEQPVHFADCCPALSKPLVEALLDRLPKPPALTLSVGCGSGLLESMLLQASGSINGQLLNLLGIEVETCTNKYLPDDQLLRVSATTAVHTDAILASGLMFVYPRDPHLIDRYVKYSSEGALEVVIWFGHRNDWPAFEVPLRCAFSLIEYVEDDCVAESEILIIASRLRDV